MNCKRAQKILEIDGTDMSLKKVKKQYHKLALLYHPDKNDNSQISNDKFKLVNESFTYLKEGKYLTDTNDDEIYERKQFDDLNSFCPFDFNEMLSKFMSFETKNDGVLGNIINEIYRNYEDISYKIFDGLEKDVCLNIYNCLVKYRVSLHIPQRNLDSIREILLKKFENVLCYKITPHINDLFNNMLYKLSVDDELYIVPLWHNEVYFENEMIVLCEPILPHGVTIDVNNNIIIHQEIKMDEINNLLTKGETKYTLNLGEKEISFSLTRLCMKQIQKIILLMIE